MDGLLLKIAYDFLNDLNNRGLFSTNIKIKLLSRDSKLNSHLTKTYSDFSSFTNENSAIIFNRRFLCSAGDFPIIENIVIDNSNLKFTNKYSWSNITNRRLLVKNIQYDITRIDMYEAETQRYLDLMNKLMDSYTSNINKAISIRLNSYVDPCYVDAGYVSPN